MTSQQNFRYFDWVDYSVFGLLLTGSVCIGIYFGFLSKRKQNTKLEYLLASRELGVIPLAMSLTATQLSALALIGLPAEIYMFGTQFWVMEIGELLTGPMIAYWFLPVFYDLDKTSMYEYLNKRFSPAVRTFGSILFLINMTFATPVLMYGPALALAQVTGLSLSAIIAGTCLACTFYTTFGGMKAVVWTDTLQLSVIAICSVLVVILGTIQVGGVGRIWETTGKGHRLEAFNMSLDPTTRHTFWSVTLGMFTLRIAFHVSNQGIMQRVLASSTRQRAQISIGLFAFFTFLLMNFMFYIGLVVYAAFADCDPVTAGLVRKPDQIVAYFVMTATGHIPVLPGLFLSAVFSASLSTMSSNLNSMSAVILEDFLQPLHREPISEDKASTYMKCTVVVIGCFMTGLTFLAEHLSSLAQGIITFTGVATGTLMGVLILAMFLPWANSHGALAGAVTALCLLNWMAFGQQLAIYNKRIVIDVKPLSIAGCDNQTLANYYNKTTMRTTLQKMQNLTAEAPLAEGVPFYLYRISYTWYTLIGVLTVVIVGMLVSFLTGFNKPNRMDPKLFSPAIRRFLPKTPMKRRNADGSSKNEMESGQNMKLLQANTA